MEPPIFFMYWVWSVIASIIGLQIFGLVMFARFVLRMWRPEGKKPVAAKRSDI